MELTGALEEFWRLVREEILSRPLPRPGNPPLVEVEKLSVLRRRFRGELEVSNFLDPVRPEALYGKNAVLQETKALRCDARDFERRLDQLQAQEECERRRKEREEERRESEEASGQPLRSRAHLRRASTSVARNTGGEGSLLRERAAEGGGVPRSAYDWSPEAEEVLRIPEHLRTFAAIRNRIRTLKIGRPRVSFIEPRFQTLTNLRHLEFVSCQLGTLEHLPASLESLDAPGCQVNTFNMAPGSLPNLCHLGLAHCFIEEPEVRWIAQACEGLKSLDLAFNPLEALPTVITALRPLGALQTLSLEGAPASLLRVYRMSLALCLPNVKTLDGVKLEQAEESRRPHETHSSTSRREDASEGGDGGYMKHIFVLCRALTKERHMLLERGQWSPEHMVLHRPPTRYPRLVDISSLELDKQTQADVVEEGLRDIHVLLRLEVVSVRLELDERLKVPETPKPKSTGKPSMKSLVKRGVVQEKNAHIHPSLERKVWALEYSLPGGAARDADRCFNLADAAFPSPAKRFVCREAPGQPTTLLFTPNTEEAKAAGEEGGTQREAGNEGVCGGVPDESAMAWSRRSAPFVSPRGANVDFGHQDCCEVALSRLVVEDMLREPLWWRLVEFSALSPPPAQTANKGKRKSSARPESDPPEADADMPGRVIAQGSFSVRELVRDLSLSREGRALEKTCPFTLVLPDSMADVVMASAPGAGPIQPLKLSGSISFKTSLNH